MVAQVGILRAGGRVYVIPQSACLILASTLQFRLAQTGSVHVVPIIKRNSRLHALSCWELRLIINIHLARIRLLAWATPDFSKTNLEASTVATASEHALLSRYLV
jgi:hypothetical protein